MTDSTVLIIHISNSINSVILSTKLSYLAKEYLSNSAVHQCWQERTQRYLKYLKNTKIHCRVALKRFKR